MSDERAEGIPLVREFADRGTLWLLESSENLRGLVEIVASDLVTKLDFTRAERINRSFVPDNLQKQEADILYRVPFRSGKGEVWVYLLLEHQSKPDKTMGLRLLSYMVELWRMQVRQFQDSRLPQSKWKLLPVIPVVFYTGKRHWKSGIDLRAMMSVPAELERFVPSWNTLFLNLKETPSEQLAGLSSAMAQVLRVLQVAESPKAELERVLQEAVRALEPLFASASAEWQRAIYYLFLLLHHKREPDEEAELREELKEAIERVLEREEGENVARTSAEVLFAQGRKEGRKEGRIESIRGSILRLGNRRFGTANQQTQNTLEAMTSQEQLEELELRLLEVESWAELLS